MICSSGNCKVLKHPVVKERGAGIYCVAQGNIMNNPILEALFATNAIRVCDPDHPFWYTSGSLGPFFINTHFLYNNEVDATKFLLLIEEAAAADRIEFPNFLLQDLLRQYKSSRTFRLVTDLLVEKARELDFDFISGGERRDFYFSILPAYFLKKPHLSIFKDMQAVYTNGDFTNTIPVYEAAIAGKRALHIADLVTEASSYTRAWIPMIREFGAVMDDTLVVVDRKQGGEEILLAEGVRLHSLANIDPDLFHHARENGDITEDQLTMITAFMENPRDYMNHFFAAHPDYIKEQMALGGKAKERAEMAVAKGYAPAPGCIL